MLFGFTIRLRPMVRTDRAGDRTRGAEIDAYFAAIRAAEAAGVAAPPRVEVYAAFARAKLEAGGARVIHLSLDGYERARVARRDDERRLKCLNGHSAALGGVLVSVW